METIALIYKWPPDRVHHSQQHLLYADEDVIITTQRVKPSSPIIQNDKTVLGNNFAVVWFVFTNLWYGVAKVYNLENAWTGYYCDIMKPVKRDMAVARKPNYFEITDLFLDLWINPDGTYEIQDEDEFADAVQEGIINTELEAETLSALKSLITEVESGHLEYRLQEVMDRAKLTNFRDHGEHIKGE